MRPWYPGLQAPTLSDFRAVWTVDTRDLVPMMDATGMIHERYIHLEPIRPLAARPVSDYLADAPYKDRFTFATQVDNPALPRLLMFRDSFATAMQPSLSELFSRAVYVHTPTLDGFDPSLVRREHPSVVIQEVVERMLSIDD